MKKAHLVILLSLIGAVAIGIGVYLNLEKVKALDLRLTLAINGSDSTTVDWIAILITSTETWIPIGIVLLYCLWRERGLKDMLLVLGGIALCILMADLLSSGICKPLVGRLRPTHTPALTEVVDVAFGYRGGKYSFFSSHAANTMSVAVFLLLMMRKWTVGIGLILWSLLNCWSRLYLGVHYLGDVLVGIVWGIIVGWVVYLWMRSPLGRKALVQQKPIVIAMLITFALIAAASPFLPSE